MIVSPAFAGKKYAVLGLARSGLATVGSLFASGAHVTAWDRRPGPRDEVAEIVAVADPLEIDLTSFDGIVLSPGVPLNTHPIVERARAAGVPLIGDIELFAQARASLPRHKVVGITGTNGKSTTTALVHHLCEAAGVPSRMGGNIGLPILGQDPLPAGGVYVLELSSYQIDLTWTLDCEAAALTNITPDHLDRYDSFEAYARSKARLFEMQGKEHLAVFGCEDGPTRAFYAEEAVSRLAGRVECANTALLAERQRGWIGLKGPHNLQNAAIASAIAAELGLSPEAVERGLASFRGLPHRMEVLGTFGGITFVNDSKATNPASTAPALSAYPPDPNPRVHWIVGGLPKGDDLDDCAPGFPNVAAAYTIGEAGPRFAELLSPVMHVERCEMLVEAVRRAMAAAKPGDVILLSPACASFDQFKDYEARGDDFRQIVAGLTGTPVAEHEFAARSAA
jgi:UDP-N-acetylmuramoylalanine--D-glutamate ligase